jgi:AcrR family transcriptional regulator
MATTGTLETEREAHRKMPHEERQRQIVEAARKIITDRGMEYLTLRMLAKEVGVSQAALYRHVKNKQQILLLVLEDIERTLLDAVLQARERGATALEKLQSILQTHLSYSERRRGVSFLVLNEALRLDDRRLQKRAGGLMGKYLEAIGGVLCDGQREGTVRQDIDVEIAARLFFGMVQSNVTLWALQSRTFRLGNGWEGLWKLYRGAVGT